jgi:hypothetical protein
MSRRFIILSLLVIVAMLTRLIPHWPNFTAVGAVAIFGGMMFKRNAWALFIPMVALFLSDLFINNIIYASFYDGWQWFTGGYYFIYGAFLLSVVLGRFATKKGNLLSMGISGGVSALLFYLITNFGAWLGNPLYPQNFQGLMASYTAGLPFLLNQAAGTLFYLGVLSLAAQLLFSKERVLWAKA